MESLLELKPPLDQFDREMLESWLKVLEEDCEIFGETLEDTKRMNSIKGLLIRDRLQS